MDVVHKNKRHYWNHEKKLNKIEQFSKEDYTFQDSTVMTWLLPELGLNAKKEYHHSVLRSKLPVKQSDTTAMLYFHMMTIFGVILTLTCA